MAETTCPHCQSMFDTGRHRVYRGLRELLSPPRLTVERQLDDRALVQCPKCSHRFVSSDVGIFGIKGRPGQRRLVGLYVFSFLCVVAYLLVYALRHG
jgi:uncharacterized Zn-finger protein